MLVEIYLLLKHKVAADDNIFSCILGKQLKCKLQACVNVIGLQFAWVGKIYFDMAWFNC